MKYNFLPVRREHKNINISVLRRIRETDTKTERKPIKCSQLTMLSG